MSELVSRTSDFQVNPGSAGIQTASDVAAIRGGFAFTWLSVATSSVFRSLDNVIVVDAYRPDGSQLLPEIDLAEATFRHGGYRDPAIIETADQRIVVAWVEIEPVLSFASSWVRSGTIDLNGVTSSSTLVFAPVYGATSPLSPDIAPRAGGGFALVHDQLLANDPSSPLGWDSDILSASFDAQGGVPVVSSTPVSAANLTNDTSPAIAQLAGGGFVCVWSRHAIVIQGPWEFVARMLDQDGHPVGAEWVIGSTADVGQPAPTVAVAGLVGGGFVAAWAVAGVALDVHARVFAPDGTPGSAEFTVNGQSAGDQSDPAVVGMADGSLVVTWTDGSGTLGDADGTAIHLRRFEAVGTPIGDEMRVNTTSAGDQFDSAIAAGSDGTLAVSWTDRVGDFGTEEIRARVFALANVIDGTIGDGTIGADTLIGTDGPDLIRGWGGDDMLSGLGGDDRLEGGTGNDVLDGGDGNDTVDPGPGLDRADGGAGVDTLSHETAGTAVRVDLLAGVSVTDGISERVLNFEQAIGSPFADELLGDAGANRLEGRDGDDHLVGQEGNDVLVGGSGRDLLDPGRGIDFVDGGAGRDTLDLRMATGPYVVDLNVGLTYDYTAAESLVSVENAIGTRFSDGIYGSETVANLIDGGPGGADTLYGGNDIGDVVSYASSTRGVIVDLGAALSFDGVDLDSIRGFEGAIGSAHDDRLFATFTQVVDPGTGGADVIVDAAQLVYDSLPRSVIIDLAVGATWDGQDQDRLFGIHNVRGSRFDDQVFGSAGSDRIDGGGGYDQLLGGPGHDTFVLRRGEADGDLIRDFAGNAGLAGDFIELVGYSAGSTFAPLTGNATVWLATDAATGAVDVVRVIGELTAADFAFVPSSVGPASIIGEAAQATSTTVRALVLADLLTDDLWLGDPAAQPATPLDQHAPSAGVDAVASSRMADIVRSLGLAGEVPVEHLFG